MSKKERIQVNRDDDFEAIDAELAHALDALEGVNDRVLRLLTGDETEATAGEEPAGDAEPVSRGDTPHVHSMPDDSAARAEGDDA